MSRRDEIIETCDRLFIFTDEKAFDRVRELFADEVDFDMTSLAGGDPVTIAPQQIVDGWAEGLKDVDAVHHQTGNYLVEADADRADVFCYGTATHYRRGGQQQVTTFVGSYEIGLVRAGSAWKIHRLKFHLKYMV